MLPGDLSFFSFRADLRHSTSQTHYFAQYHRTRKDLPCLDLPEPPSTSPVPPVCFFSGQHSLVKCHTRCWTLRTQRWTRKTRLPVCEVGHLAGKTNKYQEAYGHQAKTSRGCHWKETRKGGTAGETWRARGRLIYVTVPKDFPKASSSPEEEPRLCT